MDVGGSLMTRRADCVCSRAVLDLSTPSINVLALQNCRKDLRSEDADSSSVQFILSKLPKTKGPQSLVLPVS